MTTAPAIEIDLTARRVLVPGGTGAVGEGVVRRALAAGADVVVPTRTQDRADEFRALLGDAATDRLHLPVHDYTTFAGADELAAEMLRRLGGIDHLVAPIGGWWAGKTLTRIDESDWNGAFVGLATTHVAILRAALPHIAPTGSYTVVVGGSATWPVPESGLVSMEQAAVLMMQRVAAVEVGDQGRVFALVLGPVATRSIPAESLDPAWVTADQVGAVAVALAATPGASSREVTLSGSADVETALDGLRALEV